MGIGSALRIQGTSQGGITYVRLNGTINESFDPQALLSEAKGQTVILNLSGVSRLSSFGVREWTNAMRSLCSSVSSVYWVEVSPAVVTQLNLVTNFSGAAQVLSVQAPFYCDCGNEIEESIDLRAGEVQLPEPTCSECSAKMVFDEDPDSYFMFPLESARSKPIDPNIDVFLRHLSGESSHNSTGSGPHPSNRPSSAISDFDLPVPSIATQPGSTISQISTTGSFNTNTRVQTASAPSKWSNTRSALVGLAVPVVIGVALLAIWPSGGTTAELPSSSRKIYEGHVEAGRWGEAATLVKNLEQSHAISDETAGKLRDEISTNALKSFQGKLDDGAYADAASIVTAASRERAISARDAGRYHKDVIGRALARHRELLGSGQISAAEQISESLLAADVLPTAQRRSFERDVATDRSEVASKLFAEAKAHYEGKRYDEALEVTKTLARLGPLDAKMTFLTAEVHRALDDVATASVHYANFIEMVEDERPPHSGLDGAMFWHAKYLASAGRTSDAKVLFRRVADGHGEYRDRAARALKQ
ncbi:MAG: hypothetical protein RMA76_30770 [Deltaproteobacteria bacterium]|jgi:anti-anti-sigma regulatory factor